MKVSVMITTYNLEKYVAQTLDSVLSQKTDFPYEILVGDDGSTDGTVSIVEKYIVRYPEKISLYRMPREDGADYNRVERSSANRLNLCKYAKGEFLTFLDGDDFYTDTTKLKRQVSVLENPKNQDCVMCVHNLSLYYEGKDDRREKQGPVLCRAKKEHKWTLEDYWPLIFIQANAVMFRNILQKHFPTGILAKNFDDNNITFWLFQYGKMYYIPDVMAAYRQVQNSSWNGINEMQQVASHIVGYAVEKSIMPEKEAISHVRHYHDFLFFIQNKEQITQDNCSPFYQTAKKNDIQEALRWFHIKDVQENDMKHICKMIKRAGNRYKFARLQRGVQKILGKY